jgi:putative protein-disulfide isomerase
MKTAMVNQERTKSDPDHLVLNKHTDQLDIVYYTDPLCCWSWAFEPQWRRLQYELEGIIRCRYCMTGMISSWDNYQDTLHSVSRPIQMGPVWMHASYVSGMPVHHRIWMEDPPSSSYLACIAVKCAELQSPQSGEKFLRMLREAVMLKGENIARIDVVRKLALHFADHIDPSFNILRFEDDLVNDNGLEAFRKDMQEVNYRDINRYPTLVLRAGSQPAILMTGYRPYSALWDAVKSLIPSIEPVQEITDIEKYRAYWPSITERELQEVNADQ